MKKCVFGTYETAGRRLFLILNRYWDTYYPGGSYDALGRRKGNSKSSTPSYSQYDQGAMSPAIRKANSNPLMDRGASKNNGQTNYQRSAAAASSGNNNSVTHSNHGNNDWDRERKQLEFQHQKIVEDTTQQSLELKVQVEGLEKERDFYFTKLRDIELVVQRELENGNAAAGRNMESVLREVQAIMYQTEDGFEVPADMF